MWVIGIVDLFLNVSHFELMVDMGLIIIVMALSAIFYRMQSSPS